MFSASRVQNGEFGFQSCGVAVEDDGDCGDHADVSSGFGEGGVDCGDEATSLIPPLSPRIMRAKQPKNRGSC